MPEEYWQETHARGLPTLAVWELQQDFELHHLTLPQHTTAVNSLPVLSQTRKDKERALTTALSVTHGLFQRLADLNVRAAGTIHGLISDDNEDFHRQLDMVFAIGSGDSHANEVRRAELLSGVWKDFDTARAAETPPKPALTLKQGTATVTATQFAQLLADFIAGQKSQSDAARAVSTAKTALRVANRQVDRNNKRWYVAWTKTYPAGTPEGDAARSDVPTEQGVPAPTPLEIESLVATPDKQVMVTVADWTGDHASTRELLYQLPGEPDFGNTTELTARVLMFGPFTPGTLVRFRTRVGNSKDHSVLGAIQQVVVPA